MARTRTAGICHTKHARVANPSRTHPEIMGIDNYSNVPSVGGAIAGQAFTSSARGIEAVLAMPDDIPLLNKSSCWRRGWQTTMFHCSYAQNEQMHPTFLSSANSRTNSQFHTSLHHVLLQDSCQEVTIWLVLLKGRREGGGVGLVVQQWKQRLPFFD